MAISFSGSTPIVSGYLKSIELLLDIICESFRNYHKIRCEEMKTFTLGNYIHFVDEHDNIFRDKLSWNGFVSQ